MPALGQSVVVAVRPEHIATTEEREGPNRFLARVTSSVYLGSISRHGLLVGSHEMLMQDHTATEVVAIGSEIGIVIDPKRARVLRER